MSQLETIRLHHKALRLPTIADVLIDMLALAERGAWPVNTFLLQLFEQELAGRQERRTQRLLSEAHLPEGETLATLKIRLVSKFSIAVLQIIWYNVSILAPCAPLSDPAGVARRETVLCVSASCPACFAL